jgi:hypothetical protein
LAGSEGLVVRTYQLKPRGPELLPGRPQIDDGKRTLKVWRKESSLFIEAACARRKLPFASVPADGAFETTINCSKAQFEDIRAEFNTRNL